MTVTIDFIGQGNRYAGYGEEKYVPAMVKDETGEIRMTFWGDDCKQAKEGLKVKIKKGYVTEYRGQLQINVGRDGKVTFVK